ncbi:MAG: UDP-N-acetylmuramate dehydrogenase [Patescibacteria group bacterium]
MLQIPNLQQNIKIAPYTTYEIGGPADYFVVVKNKDELINAVTQARENKIPYFILGIGANILFGDKGFRGLVVKNEANKISIFDNLITAESGATISDLIEITTEQNLSGFEHFAGIPSTVGGALWQNLHFLSPDRTETVYIDSILASAEILDESNNLQKVAKDFFEFGYDTSILHKKDLIVTEATFKLEFKEKTTIQKQIAENLKWRADRQPALEKFPSCGSVFKKIKSVGAGRLIDQAGLKGYRVGDAQVSEKHANFIINTGNATAKDVRDLIKLIQEKVLKETGHKLETEISFVGEF